MPRNKEDKMKDQKLIHGDEALRLLEEYRERVYNDSNLTTPDVVIRCCQAIVAEMVGYTNRADWRHLQTRG